MENADGSNVPLDRNTLRNIQTPQTFVSTKLKRAYQQPYHDTFTDDATVWEKAGETVFLFEGNRENIKLTTAGDLRVAEGLIS